MGEAIAGSNVWVYESEKSLGRNSSCYRKQPEACAALQALCGIVVGCVQGYPDLPPR